MTITAQITPIPNDTFLFSPWIQNEVGSLKVIPTYADTEQINKHVLDGKGADLCKVSFHILPRALDDYVVLPIGSAIVKGTGPKIVAKKQINLSEIPTKTIAVPGKNTTAYLLASTLLPKFYKTKEVPYSEIIQQVSQGEVDCGLLIHESTFHIKEAGLLEVFHLADLWQEKTNDLPLPLGGLIAKRSLGHEKISEIVKTLRMSLETSYKSYEKHLQFALQKSQSKNLNVIKKSIDFWINQETREMSPHGKKSIETLLCLGNQNSEKRKDIFFSV